MHKKSQKNEDWISYKVNQELSEIDLNEIESNSFSKNLKKILLKTTFPRVIFYTDINEFHNNYYIYK